MNLQNELRIAIDSVEKACEICASVQKNLVSDESIQKKDKSPVTVADFACQAIINKDLSSNFNYPIVAEENSLFLRSNEGSDLTSKIFTHLKKYIEDEVENDILDYIDLGNFEGGNNGRFWTLDPIDGTKGFLRKDQYAIALALIEDGEVILGILGCPNLSLNKQNNKGCILVAERGKGAYIKSLNSGEESKINVSNISETNNAAFCESVESSHSSHDHSAQIAKILNVTNEPFRIDSQCKYAVIASGKASIYLRLPTKKDYEEKIWDHAAGSIIVEEAGGKVTDCKGNPLDFSLGRTLKSNKGIVSTNGLIHDKVIDAVIQTI